ncbi:DNA mismatch repair protein MutS [Eikenella sp. NML99-0057]|uniref:Smr/MutS family protein n=1 Tax=Eikenella sp. NML99-0057 TaxID=1795834 RepID=UPI0007DF73A3|nr:Smr/MutS family protein [Eikenella sp. NML99-0057]OAM44450.1 DNA mismatch repair protein MutS [Eikenella sp. NML99-0057]
MDKQDTQKLLQQLGKEAKRWQEEVAAQTRQQRQEELDFAAAVGKVTPLKNSNRVAAPKDNKPLKRRFDEAEWDDEYFYVSADSEHEPPRSFCKNGRGQDDIRRLVAGHWPCVGRLDLHGCTHEEAQRELSEFLEEVLRRGVCAEIVHGSGLGSHGFVPVLKSLVRRWLMAHPEVLAYVEPHGANDGAVRILLRKRRAG